MASDEKYKRAKRQVIAIKLFHVHLVAYVAVILFLVFIDAFADGHRSNWWSYWPALGWGIGVAIHAATVYTPFLGSDWEGRKIRELMDKESRAEQQRTSDA